MFHQRHASIQEKEANGKRTIQERWTSTTSLMSLSDLSISSTKKQRLLQSNENSSHVYHVPNTPILPQEAIILRDTEDYILTMIGTLPLSICKELVHAGYMDYTRILTFSVTKHHRKVLYYLFLLDTKVILWHQGMANMIKIILPNSLSPNERCVPYLYSFDQDITSLILVPEKQHGDIWYWENIDVVYEVTPVIIRLPVENKEDILWTYLNAFNHITLLSSYISIICWTSRGDLFQIVIQENQNIHIHYLEKAQESLLSGVTKKVSQFFFSSVPVVKMGSQFEENIETGSIQSVKYLQNYRKTIQDSVHLLILFKNGILEMRYGSIKDNKSISTISMESQWQLDLHHIALTYFSKHFPDSRLVNIRVLSLVTPSDNEYVVLVAFVWSLSSQLESMYVKYVLFTFVMEDDDDPSAPILSAPLYLDSYEPDFVSTASSNRDFSKFFDVDCVLVSSSSLYILWPQQIPVQCLAVRLSRQSTTVVDNRTFQLLSNRNKKERAYAVSPRVVKGYGDTVKCSLAFLSLEVERSENNSWMFCTDVNGTMCLVTSRNMEILQDATKKTNNTESNSRKLKHQVSEVNDDNIVELKEGCSAKEYAKVLSQAFHDEEMRQNEHESLVVTTRFRIRSRDLDAIGKAMELVMIELLNAKPSSGVRWNDQNIDAEDAGISSKVSLTPKLVRFQLEEKQRRHTRLMEFLKQSCPHFWGSNAGIVSTVEQSFLEGKEKITAANSLCKFQASMTIPVVAQGDKATNIKFSGEVLLHAMEEAVERERGYDKEMIRLSGYNAFDLFYADVSNLDQLFHVLNEEIHRLRITIGEHDEKYVYGVLESGYSMLSMVRSTSLTQSFHWVCASHIRKELIEHIDRLAGLIRILSDNKYSSEDLLWEVVDQLRRLGSLLLNLYDLECVRNKDDEDLETIKKEQEISRRLILHPLVQVATRVQITDSTLNDDRSAKRRRSQLFSECVSLCESQRFAEGMVYLVAVEDHERLKSLDYVLDVSKPFSAPIQRLERYIHDFPHFPSFLIRWVTGEVENIWKSSPETLQNYLLTFLLAQAKRFNSSTLNFEAQLLKITEKNDKEVSSQASWIVAQGMGIYKDVASLTFRKALRDDVSLENRKTMVSLAKLAHYCHDSPPSESTPHGPSIHEIRSELVCLKIQQILLQLPLPINISSSPLTRPALLEACLDAMSSVKADDSLRVSMFSMVLEALESMYNILNNDDFQIAQRTVWQRVLYEDEDLWRSMVAEVAHNNSQSSNLEQHMEQTLLYQGIKNREENLLSAAENNSQKREAQLRQVLNEVLATNAPEAELFQHPAFKQTMLQTLHLAFQKAKL